MRVWVRALLRRGVNVRFSSGFNPHPKVSLPLPRSVGVVSDDELAVIGLDIEGEGGQVDAAMLHNELSEQLPVDITVFDVVWRAEKVSPQALGAEFHISVKDELKTEARVAADKLMQKIAAGESVLVKRLVDASKGITQIKDVSQFIESIEPTESGFKIKTKIVPAGTIRVEEMLELLGLEAEQLSEPVLRTAIQWRL